MFADIFPAEILNQAILADMNSMGVDSKGYHYQATLGIPESLHTVCKYDYWF